MHLFGSHFGTYEVEPDLAGNPGLRPFRFDPEPSPVGAAFLDLADHPDRVRAPMVRQGFLDALDIPAGRGTGRGRESFVEVDWPTAARLVAGEIDRVRTQHSNAAIFAGSYGWASAGRFHHAQSQLKRLLNLAGGFTSSVNTYSYGTAAVLLPHVIGSAHKGATDTVPSWDLIVRHAKVLIAFGGFRMSNTQVSAGGAGVHRNAVWLKRALAAGIRVIVVSPVEADTPDHLADDDASLEFVRLRPNTDAALLLGMAHTLMNENLVDHAFLDRCTVGFDALSAYLTGAQDGIVKDAAWASAITGVDAEIIRTLAVAYAQQPALLSMAWSLQRARFGEQPYWAAIALAAMAGQIGRPGCGFAFGLTAVSTSGQPTRVLHGPAFPQGVNPVRHIIPVARITELLTQPGGTLPYDGRTLTLPDTRLVFWAGGNPFHHHQDLNRLVDAWRRPETVVVHETMWTATARHADIVLPISFPFERDDLVVSSRDNWIVASRRVREAPPTVRSDHDALTLVAAELGLEAAFTENRSEAEWLRWMFEGYRRHHPELPPFDAFWARGFAVLDEGEEAPAPLQPLARFVEDPAQHPLDTPSGRIEIASAAIAAFGYADCPGHPVWMAPEEWLGAPLAKRFPFHLLSPQPATRLHSQLERAGPSQNAQIAGTEAVLIHPDDAAEFGIVAGQAIEIFNDRGRLLAGAQLSTKVSRRVLVLPTGGWFRPDADGLDRGGNPNTVTPDRPSSSLSGGSAPNSCLVAIKPASS